MFENIPSVKIAEFEKCYSMGKSCICTKNDLSLKQTFDGISQKYLVGKIEENAAILLITYRTTYYLYILWGKYCISKRLNYPTILRSRSSAYKDKVRPRRNEKRTGQAPIVSLIYLYLDSVSQLEAEQRA